MSPSKAKHVPRRQKKSTHCAALRRAQHFARSRAAPGAAATRERRGPVRRAHEGTPTPIRDVN
eukprot:9247665-Pyramimonas_sp.AAC.1